MRRSSIDQRIRLVESQLAHEKNPDTVAELRRSLNALCLMVAEDDEEIYQCSAAQRR